MPTAEMEAALTEWHGERFMARHSSGGRIWAAGYGGTWTLISYREDGLSCTLAHGKDWRPDLDRAEVLEDHAGVLGDGDTALAELSQ